MTKKMSSGRREGKRPAREEPQELQRRVAEKGETCRKKSNDHLWTDQRAELWSPPFAPAADQLSFQASVSAGSALISPLMMLACTPRGADCTADW